ncbi:hypothetical protein [Methylobacterium sp. Leaf466]|uniref:hypothetical protein n=1 Tax=Methylobacterium sp. Leaf466 TaxID=1736386 RepID=UPI0006F5D0BB|nr:hypothetical protein [Methylobacterium sp. Leaf466]KQT90358.1 hypothetical protein ASG59_00710 [Methylobacterium sp. Leaf466]
MQFQFFDNDTSKTKGASQHTMMLEAYCEGRLNLFNPYWKRTVQLIDPKLVIKWADKKLVEGEMTPEIHETYKLTYETAQTIAENDQTEWVKMGHIGSKRENKRYIGQFVLVSRDKDGPMSCVVFIDGDVLAAGRFQHDLRAKPGTGRRKAYAFYDPTDMYGAMQREQAQIAGASSRAAPEPPEASLGGMPWQ